MCCFGATVITETLDAPSYACPLCKTPNATIMIRKTTKNELMCCIPVSTKVGKPLWKCTSPGCHWQGPVQDADVPAYATATGQTKDTAVAV